MGQGQSEKHCVYQSEKARLALQAIQKIFPCELDLLHHIPFDSIVSEYVQKLKSQKNPFLIRVAGQSGSGKSSQLVPALESVLQRQEYIKINVGMFAPFHPKYAVWKDVAPSDVRERTNGFALRSLYLFYCYCIKHHFNVLLDMTLLEPEIEYYLNWLAKCHGYHVEMHILAVPKKVSSYFIHKRQRSIGRVVSAKSANYFFSVLSRALKSLIGLNYWNKKDKLWLWSHVHTHPLRRTTFFNHHVMSVLTKNQRNRHIKQDEKNLLKAKEYWIKNFMGWV